MTRVRECADLLLGSGERALTVRGQLIHPPAAAVHLPPPTRHEPGALEAIEDRVERTFGRLERTVAAGVQRVDDGIAVRRTRLQRGEHQLVEMTFESIFVHPSRFYTSRCD